MKPIAKTNRTTVLTVPLVAALVVVAATSAAATLTYTASYDGLPVADTLPDHVFAAVRLFHSAPGTSTSFEGELIDGAFSVDVEPGTYRSLLILDTEPLDGRTYAAPGDLAVSLGEVEVPPSGGLEVDAALMYVVHLTSPLDNGEPWPGTLLSCPTGAAVASRFDLAWEPVPNVTSYRVELRRLDCGTFVESTLVDAPGTSLEVTIDPETAPELLFVISGFTDRGNQVVRTPRMFFDDAAGDFMRVHTADPGSRPIRSTDSRVAIQVARAAGVGTTFWTSNLTLSNPTAATVTAELAFTPRDADGSVDYEVATVDVPAGATRTIPDVLGTVFGLDTAAGSLELSPRRLQAWVRTSTPGGGGSYGQGYPMIAADDPRVVSSDAPRTAAGGVVRGGARSNLGLAELWGLESTVRVRLLDRDANELGATELTLRPFENTQINDVVRQLAGASTEIVEGRIEVELTDGGGRVAAALSIVDNGSDDPTTVVLEPY
jgi:hypothetical protein